MFKEIELKLFKEKLDKSCAYAEEHSDLYEGIANAYLLLIFKSKNYKDIANRLIYLLCWKKEGYFDFSKEKLHKPIADSINFMKRVFEYGINRSHSVDLFVQMRILTNMHKVFGNILRLAFKNFVEINSDLGFIKERPFEQCVNDKVAALTALAFLLNVDIELHTPEGWKTFGNLEGFMQFLPRPTGGHGDKIICVLDIETFCIIHSTTEYKASFNLFQKKSVNLKIDDPIFPYFPCDSCWLLNSDCTQESLQNDYSELVAMLKEISESDYSRLEKAGNREWWRVAEKSLRKFGYFTATKENTVKSLYYLGLLLAISYGPINEKTLNILAKKTLGITADRVKEFELTLINYISLLDKELAYQILPLIFTGQIPKNSDKVPIERINQIMGTIRSYMEIKDSKRVKELSKIEVKCKEKLASEMARISNETGMLKIFSVINRDNDTYALFTEKVSLTLEKVLSLYFSREIKLLWARDLLKQIFEFNKNKDLELGEITLDRIYFTEDCGVKILIAPEKDASSNLSKDEVVVRKLIACEGHCLDAKPVSIVKRHCNSFAITLLKLFFGDYSDFINRGPNGITTFKDLKEVSKGVCLDGYMYNLAYKVSKCETNQDLDKVIKESDDYFSNTSKQFIV
eukprot:TRINITY_DN2131_c0_g1_i1.p1 TRINITY_DN2131_c0_g1~~TRINITY_DN2131_c0_g1_i1.p1  ORF type:complete len:663 (+),score=54.59 TRINITY_DN2131_c0_g1_i1:99-1991(+)